MSLQQPATAEDQRLADARERGVPWRRWGPYVSERQWGTVREDYSADGDAWERPEHDQARSRAYRWGEDGIAGISDDHQRLCFALTLWNGADPILKERLFGLTGPEGNHGEDVKEYYFYLDNLPSHAYMKYLYKYPQQAFPYDAAASRRTAAATALEPEYELLDTGIFDDDRYFDVFIEYAKDGPDEMLMRISAINRGPEAAPLAPAAHAVVPQRLVVDAGGTAAGRASPPTRARPRASSAADAVHGDRRRTGFTSSRPTSCCSPRTKAMARGCGACRRAAPAKDAFHDASWSTARSDAVNPQQAGTKAAPHYRRVLAPGETWVVKLRLANRGDAAHWQAACAWAPASTRLFAQRIAEEADAFYRRVTPFDMPDDLRNVQRQAFAGLLWSKQYYHYFVDRWLKGDPAQPPPPRARSAGPQPRMVAPGRGRRTVRCPTSGSTRGSPAWDMAFHCVAFALIDPDFAKQQLMLLTREWYMHPNGQIPAYEWNFGDVNPPVHAWAAIRICQIEQKMTGRMDHLFLERIFQKLLINFTWWVNRKDAEGNNLFEGGFLGLDNIGAFDRSAALPSGGQLEQADGTSWMAMYCLNMLGIALELSKRQPGLRGRGHQVLRALRLHRRGGQPRRRARPRAVERGAGLLLRPCSSCPDGRSCRIEAFTIAGLIPLFAIAVGDPEAFRGFRDFAARVRWFCRQPARTAGQPGRPQPPRRAPAHAPGTGRFAQAGAHAANTCSIRHGCSGPHGVRSVSREHADAALRAEARWRASSRSTTSRPNPPAPCSAATATGAGRCGFR